MVYYAELNPSNVCIGVKMVTGELDFPNHVQIDSMDSDYMWRKYENGVWSTEKFLPDSPHIELSRMEKLEQSQAEQDDLLMSLMLGGL